MRSPKLILCLIMLSFVLLPHERELIVYECASAYPDITFAERVDVCHAIISQMDSPLARTSAATALESLGLSSSPRADIDESAVIQSSDALDMALLKF